MPEKKLVHLLIKGQFRVWCRPDKIPGDFDVTIRPSKATCANCLTRMRSQKSGRKSKFKVTHTGRDLPEDPFADWRFHTDDE